MTLDSPLYSSQAYAECAECIAATGRDLAARGWTPATSSNFSMRLADGAYAVTVSGRDKGQLSASDIMVVDSQGQALGSALKPSAETLLHCQIYRLFPDARAVLHTHSLVQTLASRLWAASGAVLLEGYELLKAFAGQSTHEASITVPVFPNNQDMHALAAQIDTEHARCPLPHGYLIDGHGIYTWGRDMLEAKRHLESFEFLLACEIELRKLQR